MNIKRNRGFTFVEVIAATAIVVTLTSFASPSILSVMESNQMSAATEVLFEDMVDARKAAVQRNERIVMCASQDSLTCTQENWANGWVGFADKNRNGKREHDEPLLFSSEPHEEVNIHFSESNLTYYPNGSTQKPARFNIATKQNISKKSFHIEVSASGRVKLFQG